MTRKKQDILSADAQFHLWNLTVNLSPLTLTSFDASLTRMASSVDPKWTNAYLKKSLIMWKSFNMTSTKSNHYLFPLVFMSPSTILVLVGYRLLITSVTARSGKPLTWRLYAKMLTSVWHTKENVQASPRARLNFYGVLQNIFCCNWSFFLTITIWGVAFRLIFFHIATCGG